MILYSKLLGKLFLNNCNEVRNIRGLDRKLALLQFVHYTRKFRSYLRYMTTGTVQLSYYEVFLRISVAFYYSFQYAFLNLLSLYVHVSANMLVNRRVIWNGPALYCFIHFYSVHKVDISTKVLNKTPYSINICHWQATLFLSTCFLFSFSTQVALLIFLFSLDHLKVLSHEIFLTLVSAWFKLPLCQGYVVQGISGSFEFGQLLEFSCVLCILNLWTYSFISLIPSIR